MPLTLLRLTVSLLAPHSFFVLASIFSIRFLIPSSPTATAASTLRRSCSITPWHFYHLLYIFFCHRRCASEALLRKTRLPTSQPIKGSLNGNDVILINTLILLYFFLKVLSTRSFFLKIPTRLLKDGYDRPMRIKSLGHFFAKNCST